LGVVIAFVLEAADTTVHTSEQAEIVSSLPAVATIPLHGKMLAKSKATPSALPFAAQDGNHQEAMALVTHSHRGSQIAESYRSLRTSILLSSLGAPPKTILLTSPLPGEGKTTTSVNSAIVLAQQGKKVLLVEADMRRPCIQGILGLKSAVGLSNLLAGTDISEQAILPCMQPGLFVLPSGPRPPHPAELLGSDLMKSLLHKWSQEFDHVVVDTPPVLSVTDASLLSASVNTVLLVIRSGSTTKVALRRSRDLLLQVNARLMGVVVNAVDLKWSGYYGYYGQKYGYYYRDHRSDETPENVDVGSA
jgi:succinoglycan biosynthesis transport protein ExoP